MFLSFWQDTKITTEIARMPSAMIAIFMVVVFGGAERT